MNIGSNSEGDTIVVRPRRPAPTIPNLDVETKTQDGTPTSGKGKRRRNGVPTKTPSQARKRSKTLAQHPQSQPQPQTTTNTALTREARYRARSGVRDAHQRVLLQEADAVAQQGTSEEQDDVGQQAEYGHHQGNAGMKDTLPHEGQANALPYPQQDMSEEQDEPAQEEETEHHQGNSGIGETLTHASQTNAQLDMAVEEEDLCGICLDPLSSRPCWTFHTCSHQLHAECMEDYFEHMGGVATAQKCLRW